MIWFIATDRGLNIMPLFHIHGLIAGILAPLSAGGEVCCTTGFNALKFFSGEDAACQQQGQQEKSAREETQADGVASHGRASEAVRHGTRKNFVHRRGTENAESPQRKAMTSLRSSAFSAPLR